MKRERGETGKKNKGNHHADLSSKQDLFKKSSEAQPGCTRPDYGWPYWIPRHTLGHDEKQPGFTRKPNNGRQWTSKDPLGLTNDAEMHRHRRILYRYGLLPPPTEPSTLHELLEDETSRNPPAEEASGNQREEEALGCLLYTSPSPRDCIVSRMPSSA